MASGDQLQHPFDPQVPVEELELEPRTGGLVSRSRAIKLVGAVTLGGSFGLLGSQESAHARKTKKRRRPAAPFVQKAALLGANSP